MIYPIAVIVIAAVVVGVILWKVIPTFASLFAGLGAELPLPTRIVIALSNNLVRFMPFIIVGVVAVGWALQDLLRDREGPARHRRAHAEDADPRADPAQDRGGAVLPHAVDADGLGRADSRRPRHHGARPSGNAIIEDAILTTRKSIERGETIAAPLKETGVFPGMVVQMIGVGEATGALDTMLARSPTSTKKKSTPRSPAC